jgi:hypothetical protein
MKGYQIALIVTAAVLAVSILVSILFNTFFLFLFLPIGFGWSFWRRGGQKKNAHTERDDSPYSSRPTASSSPQFCTFCGTLLGQGNLFCPTCGRPVSARKMSNEDLR